MLKQHRKPQLDYTQRRKDITSKDVEIEKLKAQVGAIHGKPSADTVLHLLSYLCLLSDSIPCTEAKVLIKSEHENFLSAEAIQSQANLIESQRQEFTRLQNEVGQLKAKYNTDIKGVQDQLSAARTQAGDIETTLLEQESTITHSIEVLERINADRASKYQLTATADSLPVPQDFR
jgi:hypothetical protein